MVGCHYASRPLSLAVVCFLHLQIGASILSSSADPNSSVDLCSDSLGNITVVEPGQFIIAKLQCYGCPTTARLENGATKLPMRRTP
ncbi:uncharacterized protein K444DRAFT_169107 [Hyaloscypha bicolor E]|uniref:Secreted protein n=1 Tax=Hyaloscypha bicolor E TaxID=1095630 RepID=A0A2J6TTJ1_9HELO|nr:uncharacterized protein K444DRAFT_169107 [Hyaloscypha bicolor E]PMD66316.1 hypothetical protein K444DRAFT_169107 [Hyaloscypha bicolor E]